MTIDKKRVVVVGLGYVGLPLALLAKQKGYDVTGVDYDQNRVDLVNQAKTPFVDTVVDAKLKKHPIKASSDYGPVGAADVVIICVPTPVDEDYKPNLTAVIAAADEVSKRLKKGQLILIESTINPGVCDDVILPILEKNSSLKCGKDFYMAHCPERINPGDAKWDVENIARVIGGYDQASTDKGYTFYESLISGEVRKMASLKEAEAVKVVENSFRDINIAFVNELAMSFSKLGIDVVNVIDGAATKPFSFMAHYPGAGVGGHCIPVDPYYLIEYAKQKGFTHRFLTMARDINKGMPGFVIELLEAELKKKDLSLDKEKVAIFGLSYKPNVGDLRESPSLDIANILREKGSEVVGLDPYVESVEGIEINKAATLEEIKTALKGCRAIIIATAHNQYKRLSAKDFANMEVDIVIDGRNCLDKDSFDGSGVAYSGVGR
jgi:nucleotide sugar dehydrogenase